MTEELQGGGAAVAAPRPHPPRLPGPTANGLRFLEQNEGLRLTLYQDGGGVWTIGYGHAIFGTVPKEFWRGISLELARHLLQQDAAVAARAVDQLVKVKLTANERDALIDFTFNVGVGNLERSTLLRLLNAGNRADVPAQLARWTIDSAGHVEPGLVLRRAREGRLWAHGIYG